jgi:hypothetical protein
MKNPEKSSKISVKKFECQTMLSHHNTNFQKQSILTSIKEILYVFAKNHRKLNLKKRSARTACANFMTKSSHSDHYCYSRTEGVNVNNGKRFTLKMCAKFRKTCFKFHGLKEQRQKIKYQSFKLNHLTQLRLCDRREEKQQEEEK